MTMSLHRLLYASEMCLTDRIVEFRALHKSIDIVESEKKKLLSSPLVHDTVGIICLMYESANQHSVDSNVLS